MNELAVTALVVVVLGIAFYIVRNWGKGKGGVGGGSSDPGSNDRK